MQTDKFDVNNLRIATPCPMSWEQMTGDDRKRHCDACDLSVFNIAAMTTDEVAELRRGSNGRLCARLYRRADGTVLTKDCPVGVRTRRQRAARFATAAFAAILGVFSVTFAQKDEALTVDAAKLKPVNSTEHSDALSLAGVVRDSIGSLIPGARMTLRDQIKKIELNTVSDVEGKYSFPITADGTYTLSIVSAGFRTLRVENLQLKAGSKTELNLDLETDGDAVFVGILDMGMEPAISMSPEIKTTITREMLDRIPGRRIPF